ncbi:Selenide, water dikinase [Hyphomicrobium denitrificans 1NES1]|uniref:Selenide, water dikinase n=1 Tax=Hyphomicrobium denitrificans 1NES1 TaxID=670307 RepID=N0B3K8_9HYPH|nr:selenide, water dikinase SelD [Hyphomicrobium denitrificans]AGK56792.1 Selenide, water dikinase [Hyphomicrobium denitrificans 1NES1]
MSAPIVRLTDLAHGGGCGCKLAPSVLQELLSGQSSAWLYSQLLVGVETGDDAAVWQIDDEHCIIATTDFFMPMVDDPRDFGRIAAANAISDVYAMGGKPLLALAILGMPLDKLPVEAVREILQGGSSICAEAGIPIAGGHSIDTPEPIYGLAVIGLTKPGNVRRNSGARPGDTLILTKGIGIGIYSAAFKKRALPGDAYAEMMASTTLLNRIGQKLAENEDVHAMTDVTGFGLLGHALEMARASRLTLDIAYARVPFLTKAESLVNAGYKTGASARNWASYGGEVTLPPDIPDWKKSLLTDPQTSGGLLIACASERAETLRTQIESDGYPSARIIGSASEGSPQVQIS